MPVHPVLPQRPRIAALRTGSARDPIPCSRLYKTNPISRAGRKGRGPAARQPLSPPGISAPNKANPSGEARTTNDLRKRSYDEFGLPRAPAKQSQSLLGQPWPRASTVTSAPGKTHRAKQSQSAPHRPARAPVGRAGVAVAAGDDRAKQSQFPHREGKGKYCVEKELW